MEENSSRSKEELSRAFASALSNIYAATYKKGFQDLLKAYREVESSFLAQVAGDDFLTLETKRRVTELIFYSAVEKRLTEAQCRAFFEDLAQLGYTNLEKKANVHIIYARHCLRVGRTDEGIDLLEELKTELQEQLSRSELTLYQELLKITEDVLSQFNQKN